MGLVLKLVQLWKNLWGVRQNKEKDMGNVRDAMRAI